MSDADLPLVAEFDQPTREAWLTLVDKVLKGGDFDKRLVSRTADGLAIQLLYTRPATGAPAAVLRPSLSGPGDIRQRHAEPDPALANAAILEDLAGGVSSLLLQVEAPGQSGISY